MSWDVELVGQNGRLMEVDHHEGEGGTYALGGTNWAELNVTYNYGVRFREAWPEPLADGSTLVRMLAGRRARDTESLLLRAVDMLGTERDGDYWKATDGNAGYALSILLGWAREHPEAIWQVT